MNRNFDTALEARNILYDIKKDINRLPYNRDLYTYYDNLSGMVDNLSKLEVYKRQTGPRSRYAIQYNKDKAALQNAVKYLENLILMARLMA